jgi:hypothetical protein
MPEHRSRLLFDLDSTVVTSFGHQEGSEVGYNPRYRGYATLLGTVSMLSPESLRGRPWKPPPARLRLRSCLQYREPKGAIGILKPIPICADGTQTLPRRTLPYR